jgi:hypothetical protein
VTARLHPFDVVDPPSHAIVRNLARIVDPDARPDPDRLALKPGRCGTITNDEKRNGTTTPFCRSPCMLKTIAICRWDNDTPLVTASR